MSALKDKIKAWSSLKSWRPYFIIFVLGFLLYGQTLWFNYTYFDDNALILDKAAILQDLGNVKTLFSTDAFFSGDKFYYRPILNLSFMIDAQAAGTLPFFYHLDNVLLHLLSAGLIFYLLDRLWRRRTLAFYLSLIFLVHPIMTQAVAWLPGRNDSLLAVFILGAFICFLNFSERPRLLSYLGYLGLLFLALLTKENAVALPVLVIFYFWFIDSRNLLSTDKMLLIVGSGAVGFVWFLMRHLALGGEPVNYFYALWTIIENSPAVILDFGKLLMPVNLSVLPVLEDSTFIYGVLATGALIAAWWLSKQKRNNYIIFGWLWFFMFLLPSFIRLNGLPDFLEHRLYLPFFGFLIVLGEIDFIKNLNWRRPAVKIVAVVVVIVLAGATFRHSAEFSDRLTFWRAAATESPHSPLAQRNLGVMYYFQGDFAAAIKYDRKAIALNSQEPMVHNNLGVIYLTQKNFSAAETEFKAELAVNPDYDKALFNLGDLYEQENKNLLAQEYFQATLSVNPNYGEAYNRLLILKNKLR